MACRYSVVCEDEVGAEIRRLARENDLPEETVLRQLIEQGLASIEDD